MIFKEETFSHPQFSTSMNPLTHAPPNCQNLLKRILRLCMDFMPISAKTLRFASSVALKVWNGFTTMATEIKVPKLLKRIGTHSGVFHCDEALACYMLKQLPEYREAEIIRSRDLSVLDTCDVVVDVGAVYNPKTNRFDHHQRGFEETLSSIRPDVGKKSTIKLSSAGLVYAHFGLDVIKEILQQDSYPIPANCLENLFLYVYEGFIEEIDAIDNGVPMYGEGKPRYRINTNLSARIHRLNPEWNSPETESTDKLFQKAVELAGSEFRERVIEAATVWWPARQIVRTSIENRKKVHSSGEIVLLEERCPWKDHLMALEEELGIQDQLKFVIFHDKSDSWRVQGIPIQPDSFVCRAFLHKDWRGVRDEQLTEVAGIEGCMFCHATGFIGGNKTKEGALQMALKSLKAAPADRE